MIHHDDQDFIRKEMNAYCGRTIKKSFQIEFRLLSEKGSFIYIEANINSMKELSFSEDEFILIIMRDISDRKEAEKAI